MKRLIAGLLLAVLALGCSAGRVKYCDADGCGWRPAVVLSVGAEPSAMVLRDELDDVDLIARTASTWVRGKRLTYRPKIIRLFGLEDPKPGARFFFKGSDVSTDFPWGA